MKKAFSIAMAALMSLSLAACGSGSAAASSAPAEREAAAPAASSEAAASTSDMKVAMVTDYGDITDQSFNQTTYEASKAWCADNGLSDDAFKYYKPASDSAADRDAMIDQAVEDGFNVIVLPGFAFAQSVVDEADLYPDVKFVVLDVAQGDLDSASGTTGWKSENNNVYSAIYHEEIAGYLAGYAAVKMGYEKLGYLGGMAVPSVVRYGTGFVQGADQAAQELGKSNIEIKYAYGNQFYGDADITAAMDTWCSDGTEVIFAAGGSIYTSAAEAAAKTGAKIIGVDVDQAPTIDGEYGDGICITSAMKGLAETVNTLLDAIKAGKWDEYAGKVENLGLVSGDDPTANYVQLPMESTVWTDGFTQDDYKALVKSIYDGDLTVDDSGDLLATENKYVGLGNVTVDFQGNLK